jgi:hypothetical protein
VIDDEAPVDSDGCRGSRCKAVLDVIDRMARELDPALHNVSEIARRARVHRNYVGKNFTDAIAKAKAEVSKRHAAGKANKTALTIASIRADYENLRQHVGERERENRALRRRLAIQLGEEATAENPRLT